MVKPLPLKDFRARRQVLEPEDFAPGAEQPGPPRASDRIDAKTWHGIVDLPDDVAVRTSDHHGKLLRLTHALWLDWIIAARRGARSADELHGCMLDAANCFRAAEFELVHGYYRSAGLNLRAAYELTMIGTLGNLSPKDEAYLRWKEGDTGFGFAACREKMAALLKRNASGWLFASDGLLAVEYRKLCHFAHARLQASDFALWQSNGPVYNVRAFERTLVHLVTVYASCFLLLGVARPGTVLPKGARGVFDIKWLPNHATAVRAMQSVFPDEKPAR